MADSVDRIEAVNRISAVQLASGSSHIARAAKSAGDTVGLSVTAQATLLKNEGQSVTEIASALGITPSVVLGELGIVVPVAQAVP